LIIINFFFFNDTATTEIYTKIHTLSLHDALPISFWDVNNKKWRKWCKFVSHFLYKNTYGLPVLTKDTKCPN
jgi:hypothetical protein